ncbi:ABC transporter substrate-binding protein [Clostridium algifaecis]|nr:ABC transporter substrate-binding protein [Clostridium algifaecis]
MRKSIKNFLLIAFCTATSMSILSGCGNTKSNLNQSSSSNSSEIYDSTKPYTGKFVNGKLTKPFHLKMQTPTGFTEESIIADKKGFYKEVGIIPEFTGVLPPNVSLVQSIVKGQNDVFTSGHITTIAQAQQAGANLKVVLTGSSDSTDPRKNHMVWFVKSNSNIKSAKDLVGKTIAMSGKGSCAELWNSEFLRQNGVDVKKTKIVVMPDQQQEQALKQGNIDVAILHAPYNIKARNDGGLKVLTTSYNIAAKDGDGRLSGVGARAFTEDFIKKYPDVVKAYIVATIKSQQYINNHYDEALKTAGEFLKMDTKNMGGLTYPDQKWVKPEQINFWIKVAEENKLSGFEVPGKVKASDLYTNDLNPYYKGELK